jgi:hypothetical protein
LWGGANYIEEGSFVKEIRAKGMLESNLGHLLRLFSG